MVFDNFTSKTLGMEESNEIKEFKQENIKKIQTISSNQMRVIALAKNTETNEKLIVVVFLNFDSTPEGIESFMKIIHKLSEIKHPALLPIYAYILPTTNLKFIKGPSVCYQCPENGCILNILDQIRVQHKKSIIDFAQALIIIYGICSAMERLHNSDIIHGDLQPCTVFLDQDYKPKIINYGIVTLNPGRKKLPTDLNIQMMLAPEMYHNDMVNLNEESDVYAFGMLIFRILVRRNIFPNEATDHDFAKNIIDGFRLRIPPYIYPFVRELIEVCWSAQPSDRTCFQAMRPKLKDDIQTFCTEIDLTKFNEYAESLEPEENIGLATQEAISKSQLSLLQQIPKSESMANFQIALFDTESVKSTKEYKEIFNIKSLSTKGKDLAIRLILLQDALMQIDANRFEQTVDWILKEYNFGVAEDLNSFTHNLILSAEVRFKKLDLYTNLVKRLILSSNEQNKTALLKDSYIKTVFDMMIANEPFPHMLSNMSLLRRLYNEKTYSLEEIGNEIATFYRKRARARRLAFLVFTWFAPEVEQFDKELYEEIVELLKVGSENEFFPRTYKNFIMRLPLLRSNNWKLYYQKYNASPNEDSWRAAMLNDDLRMFIKYYMNHDNQLVKESYSTDQICAMVTDDPSLIMYAAVYGASRIFQYIERSSSSPSKDSAGRTLYWFAAAGGNKTIMRLTDQIDNDKDGTLQVAEQYHQNDIYMSLKKDKKISPTAPDRNGRLPFVMAARANNIYVIIDLLKNNVSPSSCESFGRTAIQAAAENGHCDALRVLLECDKIDVNACDCWGITSLHIATDKCQVDAIKLLLQAPGINVNAMTEANKTPLHIAVETECPEIASLFINLRNVDVNAQNKRGATPLHTAAKLRNHEIIKMLLARPDIILDIKDSKGRTPYMISVEVEDDESIQLFETFSNQESKECRI